MPGGRGKRRTVLRLPPVELVSPGRQVEPALRGVAAFAAAHGTRPAACRGEGPGPPATSVCDAARRGRRYSGAVPRPSSRSQKAALLSPWVRQRLGRLSSDDVVLEHRRRFLERAPHPDDLTWMGYMDLKLRLPELLLMRVDKMTMATAVEARVPFLDHGSCALPWGSRRRRRCAAGS